MAELDSRYPEWMESHPEPRPESRKFNLREIMGWLGRVPLSAIAGWVDNPRIDIPVESFKEEHLGRDPNNEELLEIMLDISVSDRAENDEADEDDDVDNRRSRKNKLLELAESIRLNGIRVPLVLTADRRILDGNRRYFANLYLYQAASDDDERRNYATLPAWVLPRGLPRSDEDRILVELNSINDCYVRWPYFVVAKRVYLDFKNGMSLEDLQRKYHNLSKGRLSTVIEASRVAEEFIEHHDDSLEAKELAYRKLIWFDELRRSNGRAMEKQQFREAVYDLILDPRSPFTSHGDFKKLGEIYSNPEAWEVLISRSGKEALREAHFILERDRYEDKSDIPARVRRVNKLLEGIIDAARFELVESDTLAEFHQLARQVPGQRLDDEARARLVTELLDGLTSREIARLAPSQLEQLAHALERVKVQAESFREAQL